MPLAVSNPTAASTWRTSVVVGVLNGAQDWIRAGPYERAVRWGVRLGDAWWRLAGRRRAESEAAVRRSICGVDAAEARRVVRDMFRLLGMNVAESLWLTPDRLPNFVRERVRMEGMDYASRVQERGVGGLILTAHLGNFDLLCCAAPVIGFPLAIVAKQMRDVAVDEWIRSRWSRFGVQVLPPRNSIRDCIRTTRAGRFLGFMLDQNMTRDEGVFVQFFGRLACTTNGLAVLAAYTGAPVLPAFIHRESPNRHCLQVLPPLDPPAGRDADALRDATQRYTRVIEDQIRAHPSQWIWLHRRWRTRPAGEVQP